MLPWMLQKQTVEMVLLNMIVQGQFALFADAYGNVIITYIWNGK